MLSLLLTPIFLALNWKSEVLKGLSVLRLCKTLVPLLLFFDVTLWLLTHSVRPVLSSWCLLLELSSSSHKDLCSPSPHPRNYTGKCPYHFLAHATQSVQPSLLRSAAEGTLTATWSSTLNSRLRKDAAPQGPILAGCLLPCSQESSSYMASVWCQDTSV